MARRCRAVVKSQIVHGCRQDAGIGLDPMTATSVPGLGSSMDDALPAVLVVDDHRANLTALEAILSASDLRLVTAESGERALELAAEKEFAVILLDVRMPGLSGHATVRRLREHDHSRHTPVILLTALDRDEQDVLMAYEQGAVDYLVKPVRVQRLLAALQKVPRLKPMTMEKLTQLPASARRFLSVTERSRVVLVPVDEVIYLKAELKYITIRTAQREYLLEESLTRLEQEFGARFVRVHRNCLVARDFIRGFERRANDDGDAHWEVLLHGIDESLPVSRRQQYIVREIGREAMNGAAAA